MNKSSIGVFDSGLGGLSVLATLKILMPNENYIYYADAAFAPYGTKSKEQVYERCKYIIDELLQHNVKMIVIACNTATSAAVKDLRSEYSIPIVGMEPAVKPAIEHTSKEVVVLATNMTVREDKLNLLIERLSPSQEIMTLGCSRFVEVVESNNLDNQVAMEAVEGCLGGLKKEDIGAIVLGCTHFIFLKDSIRRVMGDIPLFDGNKGTAKQCLKILKDTNMQSQKQEGDVIIMSSKGEDYLVIANKLYKNYYEKSVKEWK